MEVQAVCQGFIAPPQGLVFILLPLSKAPDHSGPAEVAAEGVLGCLKGTSGHWCPPCCLLGAGPAACHRYPCPSHRCSARGVLKAAGGGGELWNPPFLLSLGHSCEMLGLDLGMLMKSLG